jgi:tetratricopeptide (TPR) repeat protein
MTMGYINRFKLIQAVFNNEGKGLDHKELLETVDRDQIKKKIEKRNPEIIRTGKFYVTEQPVEEKNWSLLTKKEKSRILNLYEKIKKSANLDEVIVKLTEEKNKYPDVPTIYNYLGIAYERSGKSAQYYDMLIETSKKFPDYIFGKISLAEYYINENKYKKIPVLLGNKFEITEHFPDGTEIYHISAVRGFYYITGRYFVKIGKLEMAYKSYFLLSDLDGDHETTDILGQELLAYEMNEFAEKMKKSEVYRKPRRRYK